MKKDNKGIMIVKHRQTKLHTMKKFLVFASACIASAALSAQNPKLKSSPKSETTKTSPAVKSTVPVKSQPVQKEVIMPVSAGESSSPVIYDEPKRTTPANQAKPNHKKRTKLDANKNLKSVKKGAYQTAPETKQSK